MKNLLIEKLDKFVNVCYIEVSPVVPNTEDEFEGFSEFKNVLKTEKIPKRLKEKFEKEFKINLSHISNITGINKSRIEKFLKNNKAYLY